MFGHDNVSRVFKENYVFNYNARFTTVPLKALLDQVELAFYVYFLVNWLFSIVGYLLAHFYCRETYMNYKNVKHF